MQRITVIDSHTGGEPTRTIFAGAPDLGSGSIADRLAVLRDRHDAFRSAVIHEPRGSEALVGALLLEPSDPACATGVIFFNNVGYLGMCGHGAIGVVATLAHTGRLGPGEHRLETPVGVVSAMLHADGAVSIENVASYRTAQAVRADVPEIGSVRGDVAWGGNWFFLVERPDETIEIARVDELTTLAWRIRQAVNAQGHAEVDHVEIFAAARTPGARSRNFVLCPGKAYDRSPCGTGTSAKLACLAADGKLAEGETWVQEGILGSCFEARYRWVDRAAGRILPTITGRAHVHAEATLLLDATDPFRWGIPG